MSNKGCNPAVSCSEWSECNSLTKIQTRLYRESGEALNHDPAVLLRTQDLSPLFEENSNIYIFSRKSFAASGNKRIGLRPKMFVMDKLEAMDIDEEQDFILSELLYKMKNK